MTDNLSPEALADASRTSATDGGGTVSQPALTLEEMNATLGSTFKDVESAKKALKDTFAYVGKRKEDIIQEVRATIAPPTDAASKADIQSLRNELFYSQNPQYKPYQSMLSQLGADPAEVVGRQEVKEVIEKAAKADEIAQAKSVVSSNSRISQSPTPVIEQAVKVANSRGSTQEDVAIIFAEAINKESRGE